jgi:uncharacterized protein YigE (DUF2233 family)
MITCIKSLCLAISVWLISFQSLALPLFWQPLAPGLDYAYINTLSAFYGSGMYAFRFNLQKFQMKMAFTQNDSTSSVAIPDLMAKHNAIIGVNGGFFSPDLKPLGLRINEGKVKNPLKQTTWWGVFYTRNGAANIVSQKDFRSDKSIDFAVQSGPRLVVNGSIPSLKQSISYRTALGITKKGDVILVVTKTLPMSIQELAEIMQKSGDEGGLDCVNALNLDGGSSTQLYVRIKDFILNLPGFNSVTDAVLVVPREKL